ncbi:phenylacetate--CoA ligase family protein [Bradyrhizobium sp. U87765 SZCCT0131]|uniref:phenylacetate--CoA ligase family protein n=1 Tax=unclassified Bradyrhizobium TaxID=2631580 RepID=UPI001BA76D07|nr:MULTISPECIES: phenylacetate--CoA ligase family protein [unclassified Bradyrhizobium]MBR1221738.1 phenylacetate--CoA ligase family protein [Bradyrhizobium sp. U87765 SZCCT0131]MBR1264339.1 phenylacetate--CoA ligase family protein [Bradyrhizobium sp. U87765 SZCCT0134]MBR1304754.1 phenylacetate--CoA ligase family protein [Bradyrhizobium sp. U87765 SZCCT0110]MBR1324090.1 phenylacetate--CoA ligase family protein [Bradyrhizobium sp. U87765 SZCCT0109]MBR1346683.1 phenylacetate--CoA ligase family p
MTLLDVARGAYVRLPLSTRAYVGRVLKHVPTSMKFGGTYRHWREQIAKSREDVAFVESYRRTQLSEVVDRALKNAPYYARTIGPLIGERRGGALMDPDVWSRLPALSRQTVLDHRLEMCTVPPETLDRASTDGSSGQPLSFLLDRNRSPIEYAFIHDAWSRAGFTAGDWRCVFRGFDLIDGEHRHLEREPALRELRVSVFHLNDETMASYLQEIRDGKIAFIHGYPSAIAIFAEYLIRKGLAPLSQIRGMFPISEKFYPHQRELIARAFDQARIVPFYGLSEKVAFAVERDGEPDTYEFNPLYGYTELVDDDGRPVTTPGTVGRIVSTGLLYKGMPLIRYDTRDVAELVEVPHVANGFKLVVRRMTPRRNSEYVVGKSGTLIPFAGLCVPIDDRDMTREIQFIQTTPGEIDLMIVTENGEQPDLSNYLQRMALRAAGDLSIHLKIVDQLPMSGRGKRKFIDQRLQVPHD